MRNLHLYLRAGTARINPFLLAALTCSHALPARAADAPALTQGASPTAIDAFHELETKYIFGFTEGSDIGEEGERAIEFETTGSFAMRGGSFSAIEQEIEFESVPTQFFGYELSAHGLLQSVNNVNGLDNFHNFNFGGLSAEFRFLLVDRGPASPFGLTVTVAPEWARVNDVSGAVMTDFSAAFRLIADTELIPNRLYAAANLIYEPDVARAYGETFWQRSSDLGMTAAMSYRVTPKVTLGGELQYYRAFDGLGMQSFLGNALYIGPTLHIQFTSKIMLAAAFSTEVSGHAIGEGRSLDLTNFQRRLANLKLEIEF
ncbi:transporter [Methylocella tundrae]|uniref:Putative MetA-pathway of phenol degradation n=1 Tax=Methylocella tundrae TaxID=227605 RepID=A0A4U8Z761_METTU|nr:transporter [Methylocella tundrae]WPP02987.1 transporter [Methylocella tundrae]VFU16703.1 putative MetA-pathway of phenol degradation [Methylocella tundrae]